MEPFLLAILISLGIAFLLFLLWIFLKHFKFEKSAKAVERAIDAALSVP